MLKVRKSIFSLIVAVKVYSGFILNKRKTNHQQTKRNTTATKEWCFNNQWVIALDSVLLCFRFFLSNNRTKRTKIRETGGQRLTHRPKGWYINQHFRSLEMGQRDTLDKCLGEGDAVLSYKGCS